MYFFSLKTNSHCIRAAATYLLTAARSVPATDINTEVLSGYEPRLTVAIERLSRSILDRDRRHSSRQDEEEGNEKVTQSARRLRERPCARYTKPYPKVTRTAEHKGAVRTWLL